MRIKIDAPKSNVFEAIKVAHDFAKWYNTPAWDKKSIQLAKKYLVHETKTGTIVVNFKYENNG